MFDHFEEIVITFQVGRQCCIAGDTCTMDYCVFFVCVDIDVDCERADVLLVFVFFIVITEAPLSFHRQQCVVNGDFLTFLYSLVDDLGLTV